MSDPARKVLDTALERFKLAGEAEAAQRARELEDLRFQVPELQWDDAARAARKGQTLGNVPLPARPMLSIPKLDQPIQLVLNQERQAHLGVQIHPLSEDATDDTAEMLQALYRRIEVDSRAGLARSWAFERAVKCGRGFYRILTELDPAAPKGSDDQRIRIKRLLHQEAAFLDPFAEEPDGSDAWWGFVTQLIPWSRYKQTEKFKRSGDSEDALSLWNLNDTEWRAYAQEFPDWLTGDGEARAVLIAEYFEKTDERTVRWRKINALEVMDERQWPGKYIPIVPVIGRELIPFDSDRRFDGIIGPNKDAQRFFNYSASAVAEAVGQEPKSTWLLAEGQEEGHEQEFLLANVRNFPYLRYKPTTVQGQPTVPPQRVQADTSKLGLGLQSLAMASDFIHSGTGAFEPSLGQDSRNVKSGKQAQAYQQQHDQGNSNWLDNMAEISLQHEARIVLDMILGDKESGRVGIYDRKGRIVRTLDPEDNHDRVMINQPFVRGPENALIPVQPPAPGQQPMLPQGKSPDEIEQYDLTNGAQYGITVTVGKAYKSRLEEGNDQLGQLFQAEPQLFGLLGDLWLNFQTWPGHKAAAERIKKMLPPPLQEDNEQNVAHQAQQLAQENQALKEHLQQLGGELAKDKLKVQGQIAVAQHKDKTTLLKTQMDNETKLAVAELGAKVDRLSLFLEERARLGLQTHDANLQRHGELHEQAMAEQQHQQALQQARQGAQQQAILADQGHAQALEQGDQGHAQALEQGEQAGQQAMDQAQQQAELAPADDSE